METVRDLAQTVQQTGPISGVAAARPSQKAGVDGNYGLGHGVTRMAGFLLL